MTNKLVPQAHDRATGLDRDGLEFRGPRVAVRNGRLVRATSSAASIEPDADDWDDDTLPLIMERNGKLVRRHPVAAASDADNAETDGAQDAPAYSSAGQSSPLTVKLIAVSVVSLLIPVSFNLASLRLPPYLVLLLVGFVPMAVIWLMRRRSPLFLGDFTILGCALWACVAIARSVPLESAIQPAGVEFLTTFGAYLAGRMLVRDAKAMRTLIRTAVVVVILYLPALTFELLTGQKLILRMASLIGQAAPAVDIGKRMGLYRVQGPFDHPILLGVFCSSLLSLGFYAFRDPRFPLLRWVAAPLSVVTAMMSLSTGGLLSFNIQFGLMLWSRVLRTVKQRWMILTGLLAGAYIALDMVTTKSPFHTFVHYATFSQNSSYNRILIWQFGSADVMRHPLFGIGLGDWERPRFMSSSLDNFWLAQALSYGLPSFIMLVATIALVLGRAAKIDYRNEELSLIRRGVTFSILATIVSVASVDLWNASYVWFIFLIGSSAWLAMPAQKA